MRNLNEINDILDKLIKDTVGRKNAEILLNSAQPATIDNPAGNYLSKTRKIPKDTFLDGIKNLDAKYPQFGPNSIKPENRSYTSTLTPVKDIYGNLIGVSLIKLQKDNSSSEVTFIKGEGQSNNSKIYIGGTEKPLIEAPEKVVGTPILAAIPANNLGAKPADQIEGWSYTPEFGKAAVVQSSNDTSKVYIAEGIETAASIASLKGINGQYTVLASLGVDNLSSTLAYVKANFPPKCVVVLLRDHDKPNAEATTKFDAALKKFEEANFTVVVKQPVIEDEDWNDVLQKRGEQALQKEYEQAKSYNNKPAIDPSTKDNKNITAAIMRYKKALYFEKEIAAIKKDELATVISCINDLQAKIAAPIAPEDIDKRYLKHLEQTYDVLNKLNIYLQDNYTIGLPALPQSNVFNEKKLEIESLFKELEKKKPLYVLDTEYEKIVSQINSLEKNNESKVNIELLKMVIKPSNPFFSCIDTAKEKQSAFISPDDFIKNYIDKEKSKLALKIPNLSKEQKEIADKLNGLATTLKNIPEDAKKDLQVMSAKYENFFKAPISPHEVIYLEELNKLSKEEKKEFQAWVNVINNNYKTGRSTSFFNFNDTNGKSIPVIDRDSNQFETIQELRDMILKQSGLQVKEDDNLRLYALEIAINLYTSFNVVIPSTNNTQEFDGAAFRDGGATIIERKTNTGTGPNELQRNFLAHKMSDKMEFYKHLPQADYEVIIDKPVKIEKGEEDEVEALMKAAKGIAQEALKNKRVEFTLNRPAEENIDYFKEIHNPEGYTMSLRLSEKGKGDEDVVKEQLAQTKEYVQYKPAAFRPSENVMTVETAVGVAHLEKQDTSTHGVVLAALNTKSAIPANQTLLFITPEQKALSDLERMHAFLTSNEKKLSLKKMQSSLSPKEELILANGNYLLKKVEQLQSQIQTKKLPNIDVPMQNLNSLFDIYLDGKTDKDFEKEAKLLTQKSEQSPSLNAVVLTETKPDLVQRIIKTLNHF